MGADGSERGPPCGSLSLCRSCSRVQGLLCETDIQVSLEKTCPGGSCIRTGLWGCPQETPVSCGALPIPASTSPRPHRRVPEHRGAGTA